MSRLPKVRSIGVTVAVAAALLLVFAPISASARPLGAPARHAPRAAVGSDSWRLFKATNQSRGRFNVPKLRLNRELSVIARRHSMAMARNGALFHTGERRRLPARHPMAHLGRERRVLTRGRGRLGAGVHGQSAAPREHLEPRVPAGGDRFRACRRDALGHGLLLRLIAADRRRLLPVEVFRPDVVQELPELLDLFLFVTGDEDRRLGQDILLREDRHRHPHGERDRVRRS